MCMANGLLTDTCIGEADNYFAVETQRMQVSVNRCVDVCAAVSGQAHQATYLRMRQLLT